MPMTVIEENTCRSIISVVPVIKEAVTIVKELLELTKSKAKSGVFDVVCDDGERCCFKADKVLLIRPHLGSDNQTVFRLPNDITLLADIPFDEAKKML